jgi:hypothetical protein
VALGGRALEFESEVPFAPIIDALDGHLEGRGAQALARLDGEQRTELAAVFPALAARPGTAPPRWAVERYRLHRATAALVHALALPKPLVLALDLPLPWVYAHRGDRRTTTRPPDAGRVRRRRTPGPRRTHPAPTRATRRAPQPHPQGARDPSAQPTRAPDRQARRRRTHQPGDRARTPHQHQDRRNAPHPNLHQARHQPPLRPRPPPRRRRGTTLNSPGSRQTGRSARRAATLSKLLHLRSAVETACWSIKAPALSVLFGMVRASDSGWGIPPSSETITGGEIRLMIGSDGYGDGDY